MHRFKTGSVYIGDNLPALWGIDSESVDLIYLDPPFNSRKNYKGTKKAKAAKFKDVWHWDVLDENTNKKVIDEGTLAELADYPNLIKYIESTEYLHSSSMTAYLTFMLLRIIELHRILKPTGSLYFHCDPSASHYLKPILDRIFGAKNFRNEIIWGYNKWTNVAGHFQRNHDTLFYYAKGDDAVFNSPLAEMTEQMKRIRESGYHGGSKDGQKIVRVYDKDNPRVIAKMPEWKAEGRKIYHVKQDGGKLMGTVWNDIKMLSGPSKERTGWPTQKPLALLRRIIEASSNEGDIVLDPFCGCGTALVAAMLTGREFVGMDADPETPEIMEVLLDNVGRMGMGGGGWLVPITLSTIHRGEMMLNMSKLSLKMRMRKLRNG